MAGPKKYIFVNGVMMKNPEYMAAHPTGNKKTEIGVEKQLAVVCSLTDQEDAKEEYDVQTKPEDSKDRQFTFETTSGTMEAMALMSSPEYVQCISSPAPETAQQHVQEPPKSLFDQLIDYFIIYEVPLGLIDKLLELRHYRLNFLVDDSGSMQLASDAPRSEATVYMPCHGHAGNMTRLEEEENRLHIFMDILAFIPTKGIQFYFMNTHREIKIDQHGKSPDAFKQEAHSAIRDAFAHLTMGATPTYRLLTKSFKDAEEHSSDPTAHYLLTDGCPSDRSADEVGKLIKKRHHPERNPMTLLSCTNVDSECEWMKDIEEIAPYTSECDDFSDEKDEVVKDQGIAFPYTRGFWLICSLVAAMNPHDLDALDESIPLTKFTLDELLGRCHSAAEYSYYFNHNPHAKHYADKFERFLTEPVTAVHIVPKSQQKNRKKNGCMIM
jgi:hypothetical protein